MATEFQQMFNPATDVVFGISNNRQAYFTSFSKYLIETKKNAEPAYKKAMLRNYAGNTISPLTTSYLDNIELTHPGPLGLCVINEFQIAMEKKYPGSKLKEKYEILKRSCKFSLQFLSGKGINVHFVLDGLDLKTVASKGSNTSASEGNVVSWTSRELRSLYRCRDEEWVLGINFFLMEKEVPAPWDVDPSLWESYAKHREDKLLARVNDCFAWLEQSRKTSSSIGNASLATASSSSSSTPSTGLVAPPWTAEQEKSLKNFYQFYDECVGYTKNPKAGGHQAIETHLAFLLTQLLELGRSHGYEEHFTKNNGKNPYSEL